MKTVAWAVCFLAAIQAVSIYLVVRLAMTGRGIFERHDDVDAEHGQSRRFPR